MPQKEDQNPATEKETVPQKEPPVKKEKQTVEKEEPTMKKEMPEENEKAIESSSDDEPEAKKKIPKENEEPIEVSSRNCFRQFSIWLQLGIFDIVKKWKLWNYN